MTVLQSIAVLGSLGIIAGLILAAAFNKLKVEDDPAVEDILKVLPGINCGACGYASCRAYSQAVAQGKAGAGLCAPGGQETAEKIIEIKGGDLSSCEKKPQKAFVMCKPEKRKFSASYKGIKSCSAANISGGGMECRYGCLGYGDCVRGCPTGAIKINSFGVAEVIPGKCSGCGICLKVCPRGIIEIRELTGDRAVYVGCSNQQSAKHTRQVCSYGCIGCGLCVKRSPEGAFVLKSNLSRVQKQDPGIDIEKIKCPTGCIYES